MVQPIPNFSHVVNLFSLCYDKGSRIVGMIEERLGAAAFLDFIRIVHGRYRYRILRVADFQRELEQYHRRFLGGVLPRLAAWSRAVRLVRRESEGRQKGARARSEGARGEGRGASEEESPSVFLSSLAPCPSPLAPSERAPSERGPYKVTILLHQKGKVTEQTVLGIALDKEDGFELRIPVLPNVCRLELDDIDAVVETLPDQRDAH